METGLYKNIIKPPANSIKKAILNYKSYISQHKCHILHTWSKFPGGTSILGGRGEGGLAPNFASAEFLLEPQILPPKI